MDHRPARAFTLIELLVVISIIASLAALLVPAINTVRMQARQATFASNQKQVFAAYQAYATDNDGVTIWKNNAAGDFWWRILATGYLDLPDPQLNANWNNDAFVKRSIFHDPADTTQYPGWNRSTYNLTLNGNCFWNAAGPGWWRSSGYQSQPGNGYGAMVRPLSSMARPTELLVLTPGPRAANPTIGSEFAYACRLASWNWVNQSSGPSEFLRYRNGAPITYADGHSARIEATPFWSELIKDYTTGTSRLIDSGSTNP